MPLFNFTQKIPGAKCHVWGWGRTEADAWKGFGTCPNIRDQDRDSITRTIRHFVKNGNFPPNDEKFDHFEGKIYEIKSFQMRAYGFFRGKDFIIFLCKQKQETRARKHLKKSVLQTYADCLAMEGIDN